MHGYGTYKEKKFFSRSYLRTYVGIYKACGLDHEQ